MEERDTLNGERKADAEERPPLVIRMPVDIRSLALTTIAATLLILLLQYAQSILIPIALGVLISYALMPIVGSLARLHVPRVIGAAIAVSLLVGSVGIGVYTLSDEVMAIVADVPQAARRLRERVISHRGQAPGMLSQVQQAAQEIEKTADVATTMTSDPRSTIGTRDAVQRVQIVQPTFRASDYIWMGGVGLFGFFGQAVVILFLVYFLLVSGDLFKRKLVKIAGPALSDKKVTIQILDDIDAQIASFIKVTVATSLVVAVVTSGVLWWLGLNNFVVWGLFAGLVNPIPYLGPVVVSAALAIVAFLQFNNLVQSAYVCGAALLITGLEGYLLTPALLSRAAQMNPVAIFVGLLFWTWVWGAWGTVLAVPMLMIFKSICDHVEDLRPIGELLGE